jgi:hypothetical protein
VHTDGVYLMEMVVGSALTTVRRGTTTEGNFDEKFIGYWLLFWLQSCLVTILVSRRITPTTQRTLSCTETRQGRGGFSADSHLSLSLSLSLSLCDELDSHGRLGWEGSDVSGLGFIGSTLRIPGGGGPRIPCATHGLLPCVGGLLLRRRSSKQKHLRQDDM